MSDEDQRLGRVIRLDLVIATCALLVSTLATGATFWQTAAVQKQLSAEVWPYLTVDSDIGPNEVKVAIENYGIGPAIVEDTVVTLDGVPQRNLGTFINPVMAKLKRGAKASITTDGLDPGTAIRPGDSLVLFDVKGTGMRELLGPQILSATAGRGTNVQVCYCSLLKQCWIAALIEAGEPREVRACDEHDPQQLQRLNYAQFSHLGKAPH